MSTRLHNHPLSYLTVKHPDKTWDNTGLLVDSSSFEDSDSETNTKLRQSIINNRFNSSCC